VNRIDPAHATLSVCVAALLCAVISLCAAFSVTSCKSSDSATVKTARADAPPITGKQWRLEKEMVAADNKEDYATGAAALSTFDAFGTMEVSQLFYHHKLEMVPAGTMVGETGPSEQGATRVRVLDGPLAGKNLWLYPKTAEKMGFPAATPTP
jgi:hypothetical protein